MDGRRGREVRQARAGVQQRLQAGGEALREPELQPDPEPLLQRSPQDRPERRRLRQTDGRVAGAVACQHREVHGRARVERGESCRLVVLRAVHGVRVSVL